MSDVGLAVLHVPDKKAFDHLVTVSIKLWMLHFCVPGKPIVVITLSGFCLSILFHIRGSQVRHMFTEHSVKEYLELL